MYKIEKVLSVSAKDLKDIIVTSEFIIAAGRDTKVHVLSRAYDVFPCLKPGIGYINSLLIAGDSLVCGGQTGKLVAYDNFSDCMRSMVEKSKAAGNDSISALHNSTARSISTDNVDGGAAYAFNMTPRYLEAHAGNICTLDHFNGILISGSWDFMVKVWSLKDFSLIHSIPHPATVWSLKVISVVEEISDKISVAIATYVTGCADNRMRIYQNSNLVCLISYHFACVRNILIHNDTILSVDNEGVVLRSTLSGDLLSHAKTRDFIYSISIEEKIAVSGENGKVSIFSEELKRLEGLVIPTISCWKIVNKDCRLWVAGSDGRMYVYSMQGDVEAESELQNISKEVCKAQEDKEFVSGDQKFKLSNGKVYQEVDGEWKYIGDNVKEPDNVFQVEFDNKYYTLSFNDNDNIFEVADAFLKKNKLREEFRDDIVEFIKKNFKNKCGMYSNHKANVEGIRRILKNLDTPCILRNLDVVSMAETDVIESELAGLLQSKFKFVALDLYRYFLGRGMEFNMVFLLRFIPGNEKEAVTFVRLITNMYADPPFNLECLYPVVAQLRDQGLVRDEILVNYYENRCKSLPKQEQ